MNPSRNDQWGATAGFVLAALGPAVGLSSIWRFSYVAGENSSGTFILVYLVAVAFLGLPLLIPFAIGLVLVGGPGLMRAWPIPMRALR